MKEPPNGLYGAFGHVPTNTAVLCATGDAPFNARQHLGSHASKFARTPRFQRSILWRFTRIGHTDIITAGAYRTVKAGARLYHAPELLGTHRLLLAAHALELLVREENEPTGIFSRTHTNYVKVGTFTWLMARYERRGCILDARSRSELDEQVPVGSHIIVRN